MALYNFHDLMRFNNVDEQLNIDRNSNASNCL